MCAPSVIQTALAGLSRREQLQLAAGLAVGGALVPSALKAAEEPAVRSIGLSKVMDLTHTLSPEFPVIPIPGLTFPIKITAIATLEKFGVFANKWELIEHNGTHIDAPCHFIARTQTLDQLPLRSLIVPAAVIDISERAKKDADSAVTIEDVKAWEKKHGRLPRGSAVFMYSGWDVKAGDAQAYLGADKSNTLHFPGFAEDTCNFLVKERDIAGVGVDTISFDIGPDKEYKAHKALFRGNKWGVECVANLSQIPPSGATVFVGATKVKGGSGGPARLIACWG
jgi:kynurenine formamidase